MSGQKSKTLIQSFKKINKVKGRLSFRGDKSISHRALLISSLADGKSVIRNLAGGDDVKTTISCLSELGIEIESKNDETIVIGNGFRGYRKPNSPLNAGNSGTTARLLTGILSAQKFESTITGDESLSSRPMDRVVSPLVRMGTHIKSSDNNLPLKIFPVENLKPIKYVLPVASAQVKSAILLAGLHIDESTSVIESYRTRNHTENLLGLMTTANKEGFVTTVSKKNYPSPNEYVIPGDISSAIFFIVLTLLTTNSELMIENICLNPTRIECLHLLIRMGGKIQILEKGMSNNELYGDLIIKSSKLRNVHIGNNIIPGIIDEIPILAVAGIFADGNFTFKGAKELRVKESDRIEAIASNLTNLGLEVQEFSDGFSVSGNIKNATGKFRSFGDHRIAMAFTILSLLLEDGGQVDGIESISISNPDFISQIKSIAH